MITYRSGKTAERRLAGGHTSSLFIHGVVRIHHQTNLLSLLNLIMKLHTKSGSLVLKLFEKLLTREIVLKGRNSVHQINQHLLLFLVLDQAEDFAKFIEFGRELLLLLSFRLQG